MSLRSRINELFSQNRSSAGSHSIVDEGFEMGRFKIRSLICKQPGSHAYKRTTVEPLDIPSILSAVHRNSGEHGLVW